MVILDKAFSRVKKYNGDLRLFIRLHRIVWLMFRWRYKLNSWIWNRSWCSNNFWKFSPQHGNYGGGQESNHIATNDIAHQTEKGFKSHCPFLLTSVVFICQIAEKSGQSLPSDGQLSSNFLKTFCGSGDIHSSWKKQSTDLILIDSQLFSAYLVPLCSATCRCQLLFTVNCSPHSLHTNGLIPLCERMCCSSKASLR